MRIRVSHNGQERVISLEQFEIFVGRPNPYLETHVDLSADLTVSRTHARLWRENEQWWVEDLASKYGTFLNGQRIDSRRSLNPEDCLRIGETDLQVSF